MGEAAPMVQPGDRRKFIEGLRGVAIGVVLVFHAAIWAGVSGQPAELLYFGHAGVDLFFVISGFCMLWPQLDNGSLRPLNPGRFYLRRALRIGPPYVVAVVAAVGASALMWKFGGPSWCCLLYTSPSPRDRTRS